MRTPKKKSVSQSRRGFMKMGAAAAIAGGVSACGGSAGRERTVTIELPEMPVMAGPDSALRLRMPGLRYIPVELASQAGGGGPVIARARWTENPEEEQWGMMTLVQAGKVTQKGKALQRETVLSSGIYLPKGNPENHHSRLAALRTGMGLAVEAAPVQAVSDQGPTLTPKSIAEQIVFHHPEIMALEESLVSVVLQHIRMTSGFMNLVNTIRARPYTNGSDQAWCENITLRDDDTGEVLTDNSGQIAIDCRVTDVVMNAAAPVIAEALQTIQADTELRGKLWSVDPADDGVTANTGGLLRAVGGSSPGYNIISTIRERVGGFRFAVEQVDSDPRKLKVKITNSFVRFGTAYVEFFDEKRDTLPLSQDSDLFGPKVSSRSDRAWENAIPNRQLPWTVKDDQIGLVDWRNNQHSRLISLIAPTSVFMGVPTFASTTEFLVNVPADAAGLRIKVGTLGNSYDDYSRSDLKIRVFGSEKNWGIASTAVINLAFPTLSLILLGGPGVKNALDSFAKSLYTDPEVLIQSLTTLMADVNWLIAAGGAGDRYDVTEAAVMRANRGLLQLLADRLLKWLLKGTGGVMLLAAALADNVAAAIPFVGWALRAVSVVSTTALLAQTTAAAAGSTGYVVNELVLATDLRIRLNHDLENFALPSDAKAYRVYLQKKGRAEPFYKTEWLPVTPGKSLDITLAKIASGGKAQIIIEFQDSLDGRGALVAKGYVATYAITHADVDGLANATADHPALPADVIVKVRALAGQQYPDTPALLAALEPRLGSDFHKFKRSIVGHLRDTEVSMQLPKGSTALSFECTIEELLVPLSASTQYQHERILDFDQTTRKYRWLSTQEPPQAQALSCSTNANAVCELGNITLSQLNGSLGYSWRSSSSALISCTADVSSSQLYTVQNIYAGEDPNQSLRSLTRNSQFCGVAGGASLVYELMGPPDGSGQNYLLDGRSGTVHVRRINNVRSDSLQVEKLGSSYGRLLRQPTSAVLHPAGYLVAVHSEVHKLEVLRLPNTPYDDADAPDAELFAGRGLREGLVYLPRCVAVTTTGSILVLEAGSNRVQAFDLLGNPVDMFRDAQERVSTSFSLRDRGAGVTYLDMGAEVTGYVYVLSHVGEGLRREDYFLDIFDPAGRYLSTTQRFSAGRMMVDRWRKVYSLNRQTLTGPRGRIEPTVSSWLAPRAKA
ncbi:twin-arginine translocation signal domain-containing protein [Limnohabitans sp.]|uniref:twin-arginine translocation signal domain-containing protein n=1 Tax=Limnohabitans sp. TaxID=1907725 RepID=UPI002AFF1E14|nr:twin-arginine translocation signal domain-containing protein [Limnohabitans sp.]